MLKKFPLYLLVVLLCFCSCTSVRLPMAGANRETVDLEVYHHPQKNRTIVFVPMLHIGKPAFYEDMKKKLDSLRSEGFVVFYENVRFDREKYTSEELDTLNRKIRKLLGFYFTNYKDSNNLSLPKAFFRDKYVLQTKARTGIVEKDLKVDLPLDSLVEMYERKFGKIILDPCDYATPLKAVYECKTLNSQYMRHTVRDEFIIKRIQEVHYKKIVLVYGKSHLRFIRNVLTKEEFIKVKGSTTNRVGYSETKRSFVRIFAKKGKNPAKTYSHQLYNHGLHPWLLIFVPVGVCLFSNNFATQIIEGKTK